MSAPRRRRAVPLALLGALVLGALLPASAASAAPAAPAAPAASAASAAPADDTGRLIEVTPAVVDLVTPAPGHATSWTVTVTGTPATAGSAVPLWLSVTGVDGPLLHGEHPLELTVTAADGSTVVDTADVSGLLGRYVPLADLQGTTTLTATASLPAAAGDEYRGAGGALQVTVIAEQPSSSQVLAAPGQPEPSGVHGLLARTGIEPTALLLTAAALLGLGATALVRRRRATRAAPHHPAPVRTQEEDR